MKYLDFSQKQKIFNIIQYIKSLIKKKNLIKILTYNHPSGASFDFKLRSTHKNKNK